MMCAAVLACAILAQAGIAKEHLFQVWTTTPAIAHVVIGIPTEIELKSVQDLLVAVRKEIALEGNNLENQFVQAMLAGIEMEYENDKTKAFQALVKSIDVDLQGIAGSRVLRLQLRSAQLRGENSKASSFADALRVFDTPQIEDLSVLCLYDIEQAVNENNTALAQQLYLSFDANLCDIGEQYLRVPLALGYARVSRSQKDGVFALFSVAQWLKEFGYEKDHVRKLLLSWLSRLQPRIEIDTSSSISAIAELAAECTAGLATSASHATSAAQWEELILCIQNQNFEQAILLLKPFAETAGEKQKEAVKLLEMVHRLIPVLLRDAFEVSTHTNVPISLARKCNKTTLRDLLEQAINEVHTSGETPWLRQAILLLQSESLAGSAVLAESYRLVGDCNSAKTLFVQVLDREGESVQLVCGLADCTRDTEAMRTVILSTSPDDASSYWFWLANLRVLQWYWEDDGDQKEIIAKINRLRKKDASLGGAQFISKFNALVF